MTAVAVEPKKKRTAGEMRELIRARYPGDTHVTLEEVRDAAGFGASRSCDALSISTWPSRGLLLRGFEVKVSRSDWKREIDDPSKAEVFAQHCDEWYIVAGDAKVVQLDELPDTWGLLVAKGERLECVKPATKNANPEPIDRGFLVAILKRAVEQGPTKKSVEAAYANGLERGRAGAQAEFRKEGGESVEKLREEHRALLEKIAAFSKASGIDMWMFRTSDPIRLGEAVRHALNNTLRTQQGRAAYMLRDLDDITKRLRDFAALDLSLPPLPSSVVTEL